MFEDPHTIFVVTPIVVRLFVRWQVSFGVYSQLVLQPETMDRRTMAFSSAAVVLLTTIFITQERVSARLLTAECTKNPDGQFLCATNDPDAAVAPPQGMPGHLGCAMVCTLDERCRHFNHAALMTSMDTTCQLFYGKPTNFSVIDGCEHYHTTPAGALSAASHAKNYLIDIC